MIIYFWRKSKKGILKWGIGALITALQLYLSFVWTQSLVRQVDTIQIIRSKIGILNQDIKNTSILSESSQAGDFAFVASKRGKYYYPSNCSKAKSLSVQNMLYFKDKMTAEAAGYLAYSGCN